MPPSYRRLPTDQGAPLIRHGPTGNWYSLLLEPMELRRGDFYVIESEVEYVPVGERAAVMNRLRQSVAFHLPEWGTNCYYMFRDPGLRAPEPEWQRPRDGVGFRMPQSVSAINQDTTEEHQA